MQGLNLARMLGSILSVEAGAKEVSIFDQCLDFKLLTLTLLVRESVNLTGKKLNTGQKNWVQFSSQVDVIVLI